MPQELLRPMQSEQPEWYLRRALDSERPKTVNPMGAKAMKTAKSLEAKPRAKPETLKSLNNLQALHISEQVGGTGWHGAAWGPCFAACQSASSQRLVLSKHCEIPCSGGTLGI